MRTEEQLLIIDLRSRQFAWATRCRRSPRIPLPIRCACRAARILTAHVDFEALARCAESMGARIHGPIRQRDLFLRLGIEKRRPR